MTRVIVVTGGGGGIGAAIAEELGRQGAHVVTLDPLVSLDGTEQLSAPQETTAGRIVAAGGSAQASPASVTDAVGVQELFAELVAEHGRIDGVVNVAGISRPTSFAAGSEADWRSVLSVHLDGYRNVLAAALPLMAEAGYGRVLGVTSGSGWRAADAGAYGCAKRAVASLTWQLGRRVPPGVVVNAISPIAVTRMVTAALGRAPGAGATGGSSATGGLSLGSMPQPEDLGAFAAYLVGDDVDWCSGHVFFAGGSEVAVVDPPRLLEVVRTDDLPSLAHALDTVVPTAFGPAEAEQATKGGGNPRFGSILDAPTGPLPAAAVQTCVVVSDRPEVAAATTSALEARGVRCTTVDASAVAPGFAGPVDALAAGVQRTGPLDAVVLALSGPPAATAASDWERILAEHQDLVDQLHLDAAWTRAVTDHSTAAGRPLRLVTLTDASTAGGRSRAQAAAQLSRASRRATDDWVAGFSVSVEAPGAGPAAELAAHLVTSPEATTLSGAELVAGAGWAGLRSHPRPGGSISLGSPSVPPWLDATLRSIVDAR